MDPSGRLVKRPQRGGGNMGHD
ncbi:hypothetical protein LINPERHAP1_LOCUS38374 [Linum perenne]